MPLPRANSLQPDFAHSPTRFASRLWDAPALLRLWHLASLDAPTVAVVWALAFAWAAGIRLPLWLPLLLALGAWSVYIGDRLLDAWSALRSGAFHRLRLRHRFHWRHRRIFLPLALASAASAAWIVFSFMPLPAREHDSVLAAAALAYFTRIHSSRALLPTASPRRSPISPKELQVGFLFTAGCALPTVLPILSRSAHHGLPLAPLFAAILFFALLAWLNCAAIERWESHQKRPRASAVCLSACMLALAGLLFAAAVFSFAPRPAALISSGAVSALLLALLDRQCSRLTPLALRAAADLALLTPLALFLK